MPFLSQTMNLPQLQPRTSVSLTDTIEQFQAQGRSAEEAVAHVFRQLGWRELPYSTPAKPERGQLLDITR